MMNEKQFTAKLFTIRCNNQKGILSFILAIFEHQDYDILSVSQSLTDIKGIILVMIEAAVPARKAERLAAKIERIDGVVDLVISYGSFFRTGFFRLSIANLSTDFWSRVSPHGVIFVDRSEHSLLLQKHGKIEELVAFYEILENEGLIGACYQPMPVNEHGLIGLC